MAFRGQLGSGYLGAFELGAAFEESETASSVLSFIQTAIVQLVNALEDTITFVSDAQFVRTVPVSVTSALNLVSAESETGPVHESTASAVNFQQDAFGHNYNVYADAFHNILFDSRVGRARDVSASSPITFVSDAFRSVSADSLLSFVQTVSGSRGLESDLALESIASRNVIFFRAVDSEIIIEETLAYYIENPGLLCNYSIFVGRTTDPGAITPPSTVPPILGTATLTLTYPYVAPTNTLILRNPDFGNGDRLEFSRIRRQTRGGTPILFSDRDWPKQQVLNLDISALTEIQAQDFLDFVTESLGQEVGLLDHENRQWHGLILNPDADITDGGLDCTYSTHLEFEGVLA